MKEQIVDTSQLRTFFDTEQMTKGKNYLMDWITFVNDSSQIYKKMSFGKLYRTTAPQIILAEEGEAKVTFNHKPYLLKKGDLILKPTKTVSSIESVSKDWKMRLIEFKLPQALRERLMFFCLKIIKLQDSDFQRIKNLYDTILEWLGEKKRLSFSVGHLVLALLSYITAIPKADDKRKGTRVEVLFNAFMEELMKEREVFRREVSFYARQMGVSQKYLANAVKKAGREPMIYWINNVSLDLAKELLKDKRLPIKSISIKLGFKECNSFTRFFRKHTGKTPGEYRDSKAVK